MLFLSSNKKSRNNKQEIESYALVSSSLSTLEIQGVFYSFSLLSDQTSSNCVLHYSTSSLILSSSLNENSHRKSIANDMRTTHKDVPVSKELTMYLTSQQNRSLQSRWFNGRIWLEY